MLEAPERAAGVQDPPEYYDPPEGLLAYQPQLGNLVNESVITGDGMELEDYRGHFNLVNAQLTQVCHVPSFLPCKLCQPQPSTQHHALSGLLPAPIT